MSQRPVAVHLLQVICTIYLPRNQLQHRTSRVCEKLDETDRVASCVKNVFLGTDRPIVKGDRCI